MDRSRKLAATVAEPNPGAGPVARPDRAAITTRLLETVRDRTGYPIESLALDLDIEADLGIDSIKRVEILGKLRDEFPSLKALADSAEVMDELARARTLGSIVDRMASLAETETETEPQQHPLPEPAARSVLTQSGAPTSSKARTTSDGRDGWPTPPDAGMPPIESVNGHVDPSPRTLRRMLDVVAAPLPSHRLGLMPGGRIVITEDRCGVAACLADSLQAAGVSVVRIGGPDQPVDWTSPAAIDSALARLRQRGPLAGIVHALPVGHGPAGSDRPDPVDWTKLVGCTVTSLFLLAKAAAADLERAATSGGACLIAATALGGRFGSERNGGHGTGSKAEFFPGQGGVAGLVKTLAREWPMIRCRVVDLDPDDPAALLADRLTAEVFAGDGWAEVGYDHQGRRIRLGTVVRPLRPTISTIELQPGNPVVISGGARGITALIAAELARTWRPTLLIVGTTPLPHEIEPPDTSGLTGEAQIKAALHARLRREGRSGSPAEIEAAYQALRRAREVRENLAALRASGATVEYAQADVRDPINLAHVLAGWRSRYGDPAGLIHGAGLIKDKLIREKTMDSFQSVLGTKLDGALNLIRLVRPEALRFTALFSSIAGRYGNVGQSDYAAANEILNKLAQWLDRRWPGRVVSLIWGPWSGVGMVSQLENHLGRRGLGMIAPEVGRSLLIDELRFGRKGDVEVIYSGELGTLELPIPCDNVPQVLEMVS
jgi:NAD(P)-dependent dehydrogenase (short-subunit alcohol dehydrogenase family)